MDFNWFICFGNFVRHFYCSAGQMKTDVAFWAAQEFMMSFDCCEEEKLMVFGWVQIGSRCFYKCGGKRVLIWLECSFFFVNWICISLALNFSLYQSFSGWKKNIREKIAKSNRIFAIVFIRLLYLNWISFDFNAGAKWFRSMKLVAIRKEKRNENYFFLSIKVMSFINEIIALKMNFKNCNGKKYAGHDNACTGRMQWNANGMGNE